MSRESQRQRIDAITAELLDCSPQEQRWRLAELEAEEGFDFRREVEQLLQADRDALGDSHFLRTPLLGGSSGSQATRSEPSTEMLEQELAGWEPERDDTLGRQRFEVIRLLAKGGQGQVSVAFDRQLRREVALKEIQPEFRTHPESRARFLREARITGSLQHPGVPPIYARGFHADGSPYYAMQLIAGETLQEAIREFHRTHPANTSRGKFEVGLRKLLPRLIDVCQIVDFAHGRGVLHRDLKPSNVMLGDFGETLVVDWGLARQIEAEDDGELPASPRGSDSTSPGAGTRTGRILGTPSYSSPEQLSGRSQRLAPSSDIYSLGATLAVLLKNSPPAAPSDLTAPTKPDARAPWALLAVVEKATHSDPRQRYVSAGEMAQDLERWLLDEEVQAGREPWLQRLQRKLKRNSRKTALAAALATLALLLVALLAIREGMHRRHALKVNRALESANAKLKAANEQFETANARLKEAADDLREQEKRTRDLATKSLTLWNGRDREAALEFVRQSQPYDPDEEQQLRDIAIQATAESGMQVLEEIDLAGLQPVGSQPKKYRVAFDPSLRFFAVGDASGAVGVYRRADGARLQRLPGKGQPVEYVLRFSDDASCLAVKHQGEKQATIHFLKDQQAPFLLPRNVAGSAVAFHPDGDRVAVADFLQVTLFSLKTRQVVRSYDLKTKPQALAFSPDGNHLALTGNNHCFLFDLRLSEDRHRRLIHGQWVQSVAWRADSQVLATTGGTLNAGDGRIYLWDVRSAMRQQVIACETPQTSVAFNHRGDLLATSGRLGDVTLWDAVSGEQVFRDWGASGSNADVKVDPPRFSPDDRTLAHGQEYSRMRLWRIAPATLGRIRGEPGTFSGWEIELHPNDCWALTTSQHDVRLWDVRRESYLGRIPANGSRAAVFHPSSNSVIAARKDGVDRWPLALTEDERQLKAGPPQQVAALRGVLALAVSGDSVYAAGQQGRIVRIDLANDGAPRSIGEHLGAEFLAVDPSGSLLASAGKSGAGVKVWDLETKALRADLHVELATRVTFSPDGDQLVAATRTHYLVWETGNWSLIRCIPRQDTLGVGRGCAAFSADGKLLAVSTGADRMDLLSAHTFEVLASLRSERAPAGVGCRFTADGRRLVLSQMDAGRIAVWNLAEIRSQLQPLGLVGAWPAPDGPPAPLQPPHVERLVAVTTQSWAELEDAEAKAAEDEDWELVEELLRRQLELRPGSAAQLQKLAIVLRYLGRVAEYRQARGELLQLHGEEADPIRIEGVMQAATLDEFSAAEDLTLDSLSLRLRLVPSKIYERWPWIHMVRMQYALAFGDDATAKKVARHLSIWPQAGPEEQALVRVLKLRVRQLSPSEAPASEEIQSARHFVHSIPTNGPWKHVLVARLLLADLERAAAQASP